MELKVPPLRILRGIVVFGIIIGKVVTGLLEEAPPKTDLYIIPVLREVEGKLKALGLSGVAGTNPALVIRNSLDYQMNIRVIDEDQKTHQLVIDGLDSSTKIFDAENVVDNIVLRGGKKGYYTYRCALHED